MTDDLVPDVDGYPLPKPCRLCDKSFESIKALSSHVSHQHRLHCSRCWIKFKSTAIKKRHIKLEHQTTIGDSVPAVARDCKCRLCDKSFESMKAVSAHVWHQHRLFCPHCWMKSKTLVEKKLHMKIQHQKKKHDRLRQCKSCKKWFSDDKTLKNHARNCSAVKNKVFYWLCEMCNEEFHSEANMWKHTKTYPRHKIKRVQDTVPVITKRVPDGVSVKKSYNGTGGTGELERNEDARGEKGCGLENLDDSGLESTNVEIPEENIGKQETKSEGCEIEILRDFDTGLHVEGVPSVVKDSSTSETCESAGKLEDPLPLNALADQTNTPQPAQQKIGKRRRRPKTDLSRISKHTRTVRKILREKLEKENQAVLYRKALMKMNQSFGNSEQGGGSVALNENVVEQKKRRRRRKSDISSVSRRARDQKNVREKKRAEESSAVLFGKIRSKMNSVLVGDSSHGTERTVDEDFATRMNDPLLPFPCHLCENAFPVQSQLFEHVGIHHQLIHIGENHAYKPYLTSDKKLKKPPFVSTVSKEPRKFTICEICDKRISEDAMKNHIRAHRFHCHYCLKKFESSAEKVKHLKREHYFRCNLCKSKRYFGNEDEYQTHLEKHYAMKEKVQWICTICEKVFSTGSQLMIHAKTWPDHKTEKFVEMVPRYPMLVGYWKSKNKKKASALLEIKDEVTENNCKPKDCVQDTEFIAVEDTYSTFDACGDKGGNKESEELRGVQAIEFIDVNETTSTANSFKENQKETSKDYEVDQAAELIGVHVNLPNGSKEDSETDDAPESIEVEKTAPKVGVNDCEKYQKKTGNIRESSGFKELVKTLPTEMFTLKCQVCKQKFPPFKGDLARHVIQYHPQHCPHCWEEFKTLASKTDHLKIKHGFRCNYCQVLFKNESVYNSHMAKWHSKDRKVLSWNCVQCKNSFHSKEKVIEHRKQFPEHQIKRVRNVVEVSADSVKDRHETTTNQIPVVNLEAEKDETTKRSQVPVVNVKADNNETATNKETDVIWLQDSNEEDPLNIGSEDVEMTECIVEGVSTTLQCEKCTLTFFDSPALQKHTEADEKKPFNCVTCGQQWESECRMFTHMIEEHPDMVNEDNVGANDEFRLD